jgi:hypothetical protein
VRRYWDEEDLWFLFEVDDEGWVVRHVELQGPRLVAAVAASMDEWFRAMEAGRIAEYQDRYGVLAEAPLSAAELEQWEPLPVDDFERAWREARRRLEGMRDL